MGQSYARPSGTAPANPYKRQRVQMRVMPPLKGRVAMIHKHIDSVGGLSNLNSGLERPRFQLLIDACNKEDIFYVALHQIFCAWDTNRQEVLGITGFPNGNVLSPAFKILGLLIRDNDQLAPNHRVWFSKFPSPLDTLLKSSEPYRNAVADIGVFLERLATDWSPLSIECKKRGYPPLVDELVDRWGLLSPTLQSVAFTATRRNLGVRDEEVGTRMEDLFRRDRREHLALAARFNTAWPPTAKEIQERNSALSTEYLALYYMHQRRSLGSMAGSPLLQGPTTSLPSSAATPVSTGKSNLGSVATSLQSSGNQPARHHYMPSPDSNGTWQPTGQQHGPARVSHGSPSPSFVAVRPPSAASHQGHTSTPSHVINESISSVGNNGHNFQMTAHVGRPLSRMDGRTVPAPARTTPDKVQIYNQKHRLDRGLIPPLNYMHSPAPAVPEVVALHQAHLRSPRLVAADAPPPGMAADNPSLRFYQAVRGFALPPTEISANTPLLKCDFGIPEVQYALVPRDTRNLNSHVETRAFRRGTLQYRLRCIQMRKPATECSIAEWLSKDTVWPESASLSLNKKHLELRRKNHHGKDLPLDITPHVILSGPNSNCQVSLSIIRGRSEMKDFSYFLAVEVIEVLQHDQVLEMVGNNRIPADISLEKIKRSLAGPVDAGDDEIAMVVSDVSIDLADPFTARIYEIPVRGSSCLHRECFDLQTFLLTRASKPKRQGQPCMIDVWKCPLCGKDARPYSLQIDEFLVSIRETLETQGNLDVKAIWIGADGKWRPKVEKRKAPRDPDDSDFSGDNSERPSDNATSTKKPHSNRVVIDLDDD
ncbi:hypothetical protein PZA11_004199 [Diplocarpon coronariae]